MAGPASQAVHILSTFEGNLLEHIEHWNILNILNILKIPRAWRRRRLMLSQTAVAADTRLHRDHFEHALLLPGIPHSQPCKLPPKQSAVETARTSGCPALLRFGYFVWNTGQIFDHRADFDRLGSTPAGELSSCDKVSNPRRATAGCGLASC